MAVLLYFAWGGWKGASEFEIMPYKKVYVTRSFRKIIDNMTVTANYLRAGDFITLDLLQMAA